MGIGEKEALKKFRQFLPDYIKNDDVLFGKLVKLSYSRVILGLIHESQCQIQLP